MRSYENTYTRNCVRKNGGAEGQGPAFRRGRKSGRCAPFGAGLLLLEYGCTPTWLSLNTRRARAVRRSGAGLGPPARNSRICARGASRRRPRRGRRPRRSCHPKGRAPPRNSPRPPLSVLLSWMRSRMRNLSNFAQATKSVRMSSETPDLITEPPGSSRWRSSPLSRKCSSVASASAVSRNARSSLAAIRRGRAAWSRSPGRPRAGI